MFPKRLVASIRCSINGVTLFLANGIHLFNDLVRVGSQYCITSKSIKTGGADRLLSTRPKGGRKGLRPVHGFCPMNEMVGAT